MRLRLGTHKMVPLQCVGTHVEKKAPKMAVITSILGDVLPNTIATSLVLSPESQTTCRPSFMLKAKDVGKDLHSPDVSPSHPRPIFKKMQMEN